MKLCAMRFGGYTWHHNPKTLSISSGKKIVEVGLPYATDIVKNFGDKPLRISGIGELYGEDCIAQYEQLRKLFEKGGCDILSISKLPPIYAYFEKLSVVADEKKDVLTYSFSFSQVEKEKDEIKTESFYTAKKYQTMWDISRECSVDIEKLVALNPDIMFLNELKEDQEVRVC